MPREREDNMKKYAVICILVLLIGTVLFGTASAEGGTTTDNGFTWDADGVLISYSGPADGEVVIPSNITGIGMNAFAGRFITKVTIPASVTFIGDQAFIYCSSLKTVVFEDASESKLKTLGARVFMNCSSLQSVDIPDSVTEMGAMVFTNCTNLQSVTLPKKLTSFDVTSFQYCASLTELTIPDCVTEISGYSFSGCSKLASVTIPDSVKTVQSAAFYNLPALESVTIGAGVTEIKYNAFGTCPKLTSVAFVTPGADCTLGDSCFSGCTSLSAITLPRVTSIGSTCFSGDSLLSSITLGEGLTTISSNAFYSLPSLKEITIPKTVTYIGTSAFTNCTGLEKVILEDGVTAGEDGYAFSYCTGLKEIYIPGSMKNVGASMFSNCTNLQKVTFGEGVESIYSGSFSYCSKLESVTLPSTLTDFDSDIFYECEKLNGIRVSEGAGDFRGTTDGQALMNGSTLIWLASDTTPIPSDVDTIGDKVFSGNEQLRSLVLPENIKYIAAGAFQECYRLEKVVLPSRLIGIGEKAFRGCSNLSQIALPATVSEIGPEAFASCPLLRNFTVAEGNPYYSYESKALVDLRDGLLLWGDFATEIPDNVRIIAQNAFGTADTHKSILLPEGVTTIRESAFYFCPTLATVDIPDTVTTIENSAFTMCEELRFVSIPEGLAELNYIFDYCPLLECIAFPKNDIVITYGFLDRYNESSFRMLVYPNSTAEKFAKENGFRYEYYYDGGKAVSFTGDLLSLEESYILYVYTDYGDEMTSIPNGISAKVTYPDGRVICNIQPSEKENLLQVDAVSGRIYPFGIPFAAKELNDEVVVQIFQNGTDIAVSDPITVSVVKYCKDLCQQEGTTEAQKNLVEKLLTFATYSQLYFGYKTDDLAKPVSECSLSDAEDVVKEIGDCPEEPVFVGNSRYAESLYVYGTSLVLESTITYRIYFTTDNSDTPSHCALESADGENDLYYSDFPLGVITDLGTLLHLRLNDVYGNANPMAYIKAVLTGNSNEKLKNVCLALYDYYSAAKALAE